MHVNVEDVPGREIAPGVVERVLMKKSEADPEGMVSAHHYTLTDGGTLIGFLIPIIHASIRSRFFFSP